MFTKIKSNLFFILMLFIFSCSEKNEKVNLYGVQTSEASRTSPQAYLVFFIIIAIIAIGGYTIYKKITKK